MGNSSFGLQAVIIMVDNNYTSAAGSKLDEYVNMASGTPNLRTLKFYDVKHTPDMDELKDFNKKHMTMCIPDLDTVPTNPSASVAMKYGCQLIAMCFQNFDSYDLNAKQILFYWGLYLGFLLHMEKK